MASPRSAFAWACACAGAIGVALIVGSFVVAAPVSARATELLIDFLVHDSAGRPIKDLRPDEVTLRVGREAASIDRLRFVPTVIEGGGARRMGRFGDLEAELLQRNFLVVVDDESLPQGSEQSTRDMLAGFVRSLPPTDRIGLATVPHGGIRASLSADRVRLLQAVQQISGRATTRETAADAACRARSVLRELDGLLQTVGQPNPPLVLVFVSGSMYDGGGAIQAPLGTSIGCDLQLSDFQRLTGRVALSRSYIYIVQPETFSTTSWSTNPRAGLEHFAGATGGRILQLSGQDPNLLERARYETSGIYLAAVALRADLRQGSVQTLSVRVSRPGATVVARPQLVVSNGATPSR